MKIKKIFTKPVFTKIFTFIVFFSFFAFKNNDVLALNSIVKSYTGEDAVGKVRIVFEVTKFPKYRVFVTSKPQQLVIDIQDCAPNKKMTFEHKLFKSYTIGSNSTSDLRIKIDLNDKVTVKQSLILKPGNNKQNYRLVVDLIKSKKVEISKKDSKKDNKKDLKNSKKEKVKEVKKDQSEQKKSENIEPIKSAEVAVSTSDSIDKIVSKIDPETGTVKYIIKKKTDADINPNNLTAKITPIVVIDAGHGGKDPGTIGKYARTKEKNVTLAYAKELKKHLDKTGKFKTFLTRGDDYFIPLDERVSKSRKLKADLFISIHADSASDSNTKGLSIYTLSEKSSDDQAEKLAQKENRADIIGGADFSKTNDDDILKTLINMAQRNSMNNSAKFAEMAIKYFDANNVTVLQNSHRFAGFRVLTAPDIPAVLIEIGYLSNKAEERVLNSLNHREDVAKSLVKSIDTYFSRVKE
jgi:N-acetylmuramoyl-L-alanine amidase